jgi:hypothetical protein
VHRPSLKEENHVYCILGFVWETLQKGNVSNMAFIIRSDLSYGGIVFKGSIFHIRGHLSYNTSDPRKQVENYFGLS